MWFGHRELESRWKGLRLAHQAVSHIFLLREGPFWRKETDPWGRSLKKPGWRRASYISKQEVNPAGAKSRGCSHPRPGKRTQRTSITHGLALCMLPGQGGGNLSHACGWWALLTPKPCFSGQQTRTHRARDLCPEYRKNSYKLSNKKANNSVWKLGKDLNRPFFKDINGQETHEEMFKVISHH